MQDLRALVVDDSKVGRLTMMKKLEAMGIQVDLAESGPQALEYLAQRQPDMIFMDHMMPEMDGFEVTRRVKASPVTKHIPVIIVSGNDEAAFVQEARSIGAVDAIAKPPATEVLEALLASLPRLVAAAGAAAEAAPEPVPGPAPAPALDMAQVHALVDRLVSGAVASLRAEAVAETGLLLEAELDNQRKALKEWGDRLDQQSAVLADLRRGVAEAASLEGRLQALEQRFGPLEELADRPLPDFAAVQAELDQRIAAGLAETQGLVAGQAPMLERLRQDMQARVEEHDSQVEQRFVGLDGRLETLSGDVTRVSADVQSAQAAMEQGFAQMREAVDGARQRTAPAQVAEVEGEEAVGVAVGEALQSIQAELAELREGLSESRLRELVAEALADHQTPAIAPPMDKDADEPAQASAAPSSEAQPAMADEAAPQAGSVHAMASQSTSTESLLTEVAELKEKLKTLTTMTAVGGAVLLAVIAGLVLMG